MSNIHNYRNGLNSPVEMPFELQLALGEIEQTDPLAARIITFAWNYNEDPDDSLKEDPSWRRQRRNRNRAAAQLDAQEREANRSDSDPEPESQDPRHHRSALSRRLRDRISHALEELDIDESIRDILQQHFDDRFHLIASPDPATEPPEIFANTSLDDSSVWERSERPPVSRSANTARTRALERHEEFLGRVRDEAAEYRAQELHREQVRETDAREDRLRRYRNSGEDRLLLDELERRVQEFAISDPEAYNFWNIHRGLTRQATDCTPRQYQMLLWYRGGPEESIHDVTRHVPLRRVRQIQRVERYYTELARLECRVANNQSIQSWTTRLVDCLVS